MLVLPSTYDFPDQRPIPRALAALELDEIPVVAPAEVVGALAHPDGAGAGGQVPLVLVRLGFGEDVAEEGLEDGHAAADEAGVDLDDAVV